MTAHPSVMRVDAWHDLHFNMTRLIPQNVRLWKAFALHQQALAEGDPRQYQTVRKADKGIKAFLSTVEFHDRPNTEVWVAFAANAACWPGEQPDPASVEMWVSMATSTSARFTGHMGISRSISYAGPKHGDLACALHSFVAHASLDLYPDKVFMLTVPASRMREIIVNTFQNAGLAGEIFVGDDSGRVRLGSNEIAIDAIPLGARLARRDAMRRASQHRLDKYLPEYEENELAISLLKQALHRQRQSRAAPVRLARDSQDRCTSLQLYGRDGLLLHDLGPNDMNGEFAWFFQNPYFVRNPRQPVVTVDLQTLAGLIPLVGRCGRAGPSAAKSSEGSFNMRPEQVNDVRV